MRTIPGACAVVAALIAASACGGGGGDEPKGRYGQYKAIMQERSEMSGYKEEPADEIETVAENLCDNTQSDHESLVRTLTTIESEPLGSIVSKAAVIKVWCPTDAPLYQAAVEATAFGSLAGVKDVFGTL